MRDPEREREARYIKQVDAGDPQVETCFIVGAVV